MTLADTPYGINILSTDNSKALQDASIMIVDDESITIDVVQVYLEDFGYRKFVKLEDSREAMNVLKDTNPDILLLDLVMPDVSGFDILKLVRNHPKFMHLPVIILTASSDPESKLRALDLGATDFLAKPVDQSELGLRVRNTLAAKAYVDQLAYYDPLTKLPNKLMFQDRYSWALNKAKRYNEKLALLYIALNNFAKINATFGVVAGDEVLRQISQRIVEVIRNVDLISRVVSDNEEPVSLFRVEGAVFTLLLDRIKSSECAASVAERIIQAIIAPLPFDDTNIYPTVCIGIATYPDEGEDCATLQKLASTAKDYATSKRENSFQFSSAGINELYEKRFRLESKLRKALEREELVLHYQPKVSVKTGAIQGVEALLRWKDGAGGRLVPPNDFIPLSEDTGLIVPFGEWALNEACSQLVKWSQARKIPITMAVNLSVKQFAVPDFFDSVKKIIGHSGVDPELLKLEITESLLLDDLESKISILHQLKNLGVKLSIDDFGTGYSSLRYLSKLPLDELKIDRSFIMDACKNNDSRAIVSTVIFLSHSLGLLTVAEGVETEEQLNLLKEENCDQYQGFLFSRPLPANELTNLLPDIGNRVVE